MLPLKLETDVKFCFPYCFTVWNFYFAQPGKWTRRHYHWKINGEDVLQHSKLKLWKDKKWLKQKIFWILKWSAINISLNTFLDVWTLNKMIPIFYTSTEGKLFSLMIGIKILNYYKNIYVNFQGPSYLWPPPRSFSSIIYNNFFIFLFSFHILAHNM